MQVSGLYIYPLKSARGIALNAMPLDDVGPCFDRRWMLIDDDARFVSQRELARLALVETSLRDGHLTVRAPGHDDFLIPAADDTAPRIPVTIWNDVTEATPVSPVADAWFGDVLETHCRLVHFPTDAVRIADRTYAPQGQRVGFADGFPLLVISEASLDDLNARLVAREREPLPMDRFRPNLVVAGAPAFAEDAWNAIRVGDADGVRLSIVKPCARCSITTVDQATGIRGKEPLATLATYRRGADGSVFMGQNALHDRAGVLRIGDAIVAL